MEYQLIRFLHVLLAIIAVGFNASFAIWIAHGRKEPEHLAHVLRGVKILDDRFANPAYVLLLLSGLFMVFQAGYPLTTFWIAAGLVLWVLVAVLGLAVYSPTLRAQIQGLETDGPDSAAFASLAKRGAIVGMLLAAIVVVIVFLMVVKPNPV